MASSSPSKARGGHTKMASLASQTKMASLASQTKCSVLLSLVGRKSEEIYAGLNI